MTSPNATEATDVDADTDASTPFVPTPAGLGTRLVARILDALILGVPIAVLLFLIELGHPDAGPVAVLEVFFALAVIVYDVGMVGLRGRTYGKQIMNISVVHTETGTTIGLSRSILRWLVLGVLGYLIAALSTLLDRSGRHRGWHDMVGKDLVVVGLPAEGEPDSPLTAHVQNYVARVRGGDMGSLPAVSGLIVLAVIFSLAESSFHSLFNFGNMFTEGSSTIFIAMGLVFVLLLGEIDLAAGYTAGVCAAVMVRLMVGYSAPWPVSIGSALLTGIVIGFIIGWLRAKVRIPSFIVTLAFFLAFQGVMLYIVNNFKGQKGDITITDKVVNAFANSQLPLWAGWTLGIVVIAGYAANKLWSVRARQRQKLAAEPVGVWVAKIVAVAVLTLVVIYALSQNRALNSKPIPTNVNGKIVFVTPGAVEGVPYVVPVLLVLFVVWTLMLGRTRYGRHLYAVGGNEEAARRAGIPVERIRISVFVLSGFMAAIGGIMIGSNVSSVSVANYGGNTLLLAVGAAVIGGTSLFGGKGRMIDAVVGGAVVEVIYNGMANLVQGTNSSAIQYMATGLALLLAAAVDALSRRRAGASGLA